MSEDEWPGAVYPDYCAGWVYVTTTATLAAVLAWAQEGEERSASVWIVTVVHYDDCRWR